MKKLVFLLILTVFTVVVAVSCGDTEIITSAKETVSESASSAATAPETTKTVLITTHINTSSTIPPETTKTPVAESTVPTTTTVLFPETTAAPITYTASSWMGALPDEMLLTNIAMPGTHDSGATVDILSGTTKCQCATIAEQLAMGVRFLDIRLRRVDGTLHVYHGFVDQKLTFDEVLTACYAFLAENPSEALIMSIKEEYDALGTNNTFDAMVAAKINENSARWHTNPAVPTLGDVRGKIVLMRRYSASGSFGINASSGWSDNTTFTLNAGGCVLSVQDYYQNSGVDAKWSAVYAMFAKMKYQNRTYYLNFTSGYVSGALGLPDILTVKDGMHPKLVEYLKTSPDFVGIVIVDYITDEIAQLTYEVNFQ